MARRPRNTEVNRVKGAIRNLRAIGPKGIQKPKDSQTDLPQRGALVRILRDDMITLQIVPDRGARNFQVADLARAMHEMYQLPLRRFSFGKWQLRYKPQEHLTFDITMEPDAIRFWLSVPERWAAYAFTKMQTIWPGATVRLGHAPKMDPDKAACGEITLMRHDFYALNADKNDNRPLNSLMEISKDLRDGDYARAQVLMTPQDRQQWAYDATKAYQEHRDGKTLMRKDVTPAALARWFGETLNTVFEQAAEFLTDLFGMDKQAEHIDFFKMLMTKQEREVSMSTLMKIMEPTFAGSVRLAAVSDSRQRSEFLVKSMAAGYNDLAENNEFKLREIRKQKGRNAFVTSINEHAKPKVTIAYSVFSAGEIGKLMQIPGAELQDAFPAIEQVPLRENMLHNEVTQGGLWIGDAKYHGKDVPIFMPTDNHDILCLPHIVIGGMGTGKTRGFGANLAVQAVRAGFGAIIIDPAKGELGDEIETQLAPDQIVRVRLGKAPITLDWCEAKYSDKGINRFANELIQFTEAASEEAGAQTIRFMRAAAKAVPNNRLDEVIRLFQDENYRKAQIPNMRPMEAEIWKEFDKLSPARQVQIAMPVYNKLDVIMGDDYLAECMNSTNSLDFVEMLSKAHPGRAIVIDIPKQELGAEGVDVLASLINSKISLAMTQRDTNYPVFIIQDEPHQYLRSARSWRAAAVESRKWRFSYVWMFHSWEQIPRELGAIIKSALPHYHIFTSSKETYKALAEEIVPFTMEEGIGTPFHWAINVLRSEQGNITPFLAHMAPPPSAQPRPTTPAAPTPAPAPAPEQAAAK